MKKNTFETREGFIGVGCWNAVVKLRMEINAEMRCVLGRKLAQLSCYVLFCYFLV